MKKYLLTIIISLIVGFLFSIYILNQYTDFKGITVYKEGTMLYFIEYGIYNDYSEMEKNTINLENYIYHINDNRYHVYIGIAKNYEVLNKISDYFKDMGFNISIKEFYIMNDEFIKIIENNDEILLLTDDKVVIGEVVSEGLTAYEEVVINKDKN